MIKLTRAEAGQRGGRSTVKKYGRGYMAELGKKGAASFHAKYRLVPVGIADFAIVHRETGQPTGKTILGLTL